MITYRTVLNLGVMSAWRCSVVVSFSSVSVVASVAGAVVANGTSTMACGNDNRSHSLVRMQPNTTGCSCYNTHAVHLGKTKAKVCVARRARHIISFCWQMKTLCSA